MVLAAGAYSSPAILLQRIGPAGHFVRSAYRSSPTVRWWVPTSSTIRWSPSTCPPRRALRAAFSVLLTMHSSLAPAADPPDLHVFLAGPFDNPSVPSGAVAGIVTGLLSPRSRGSLRLRSADPAQPPLIDPAYLRHPDDMTRMVEATREARRIGRTTPLVELVPGPEITPGEAVCDDAGLARSIRERVAPTTTPSGRGWDRPGRPRSTHAVRCTASTAWIADASVMPTIPSAGTNLPTIAVAERTPHGWSSDNRSSSGPDRASRPVPRCVGPPTVEIVERAAT